MMGAVLVRIQGGRVHGVVVVKELAAVGVAVVSDIG